MEHENPQPEAVNEDAIKKVRSKSSKQATVLKQLSNQNLYPIQERIGIYMIAILSTVGLALIIYTGVMTLINTVVPDESMAEVRPDLDLDMDLDGIDNILGEISDVLEDSDEADEADFQQDAADLHQYAEEDPEYGVINSDMVDFMSGPSSGGRHAWLQTGDEVKILQLDYETHWTHIETTVDFGAGPALVQGFVYRHLIDVD